MKQKTDRDPETIRALPARPAAQNRPAFEGRLQALTSLLGDDSHSVWQEVRRQFENAGAAAQKTLQRAAGSDVPLVRARARSLLLEREKRLAIRRLVGHLARPEADFERSLFLLARHHTPRLDPRPYQRALDAMASEVSRRAKGMTDPIERALVLPAYLGRELDYGGNIGEFHHPDNIHLHRAIERRAGMPLTLCAIYLFVARRAGIRAALLPLPGHVMLRLHGHQRSVIIDPYHKGQARSERDCRKYLDKNGLPFQPAWLRDADDASMFRRQLMNLLRSAQMRGLKREMRELNHVLRVLEPRAEASPSSR